MLVLANNPEKGPSIIQKAERFAWFQNPKSSADEYARLYCKYLGAGVRGNVADRKRYAARLGLLNVSKIYRGALKVT